MPSLPELKETLSKSASALLTPHILVVDDDVTISEQMERLFSHYGYKATVAYRAEQALELLKKEDVDLVVTDVRLPGMDGVELTKRIAERWSDVPVIVVTGHGDIDTAVEVLKLGASDFLVKPFSAAALHEAIRMGLEKARFFY